MKKFGLALMLAAMPSVALAQAPACMPQNQAAALVTFALPTLVERVAKRCQENLPPTAYLESNGQMLADRYRPDAAAAWPYARQAIAQIFSQFLGQKMPAEMNSDLVRTLAEPAIGGFLAKQVNREDCFVANETILNTSALSGTQIGRLAALAASIAERKGKGIAEVLKVCRLEPTEQ